MSKDRISAGDIAGAAVATYVGAKVGAGIGENLAADVRPKLPEIRPEQVDTSEAWRIIKKAQGTNLFRGIFTGFLLYMLIATIYGNSVGWKHETGNTLLGIFAFICWAMFRSCEASRLSAAIKAYVLKGIEDLDYLQFKHVNTIGIPSAKEVEEYNKKVKETKDKLANPHFDDEHFPDYTLLSLDALERTYNLFNSHSLQNEKNMVFWLMVQSEAKQQEVLDKMKVRANAIKVERYDKNNMPTG